MLSGRGAAGRPIIACIVVRAGVHELLALYLLQLADTVHRGVDGIDEQVVGVETAANVNGEREVCSLKHCESAAL